jgi:hypothetical protein
MLLVPEKAGLVHRAFGQERGPGLSKTRCCRERPLILLLLRGQAARLLHRWPIRVIRVIRGQFLPWWQWFPRRATAR